MWNYQNNNNQNDINQLSEWGSYDDPEFWQKNFGVPEEFTSYLSQPESMKSGAGDNGFRGEFGVKIGAVDNAGININNVVFNGEKSAVESDNFKPQALNMSTTYNIDLEGNETSRMDSADNNDVGNSKYNYGTDDIGVNSDNSDESYSKSADNQVKINLKLSDGDQVEETKTEDSKVADLQQKTENSAISNSTINSDHAGKSKPEWLDDLFSDNDVYVDDGVYDEINNKTEAFLNAPEQQKLLSGFKQKLNDRNLTAAEKNKAYSDYRYELRKEYAGKLIKLDADKKEAINKLHEVLKDRYARNGDEGGASNFDINQYIRNEADRDEYSDEFKNELAEELKYEYSKARSDMSVMDYANKNNNRAGITKEEVDWKEQQIGLSKENKQLLVKDYPKTAERDIALADKLTSEIILEDYQGYFNGDNKNINKEVARKHQEYVKSYQKNLNTAHIVNEFMDELDERYYNNAAVANLKNKDLKTMLEQTMENNGIALDDKAFDVIYDRLVLHFDQSFPMTAALRYFDDNSDKARFENEFNSGFSRYDLTLDDNACREIEHKLAGKGTNESLSMDDNEVRDYANILLGGYLSKLKKNHELSAEERENLLLRFVNQTKLLTRIKRWRDPKVADGIENRLDKLKCRYDAKIEKKIASHNPNKFSLKKDLINSAEYLERIIDTENVNLDINDNMIEQELDELGVSQELRPKYRAYFKERIMAHKKEFIINNIAKIEYERNVYNIEVMNKERYTEGYGGKLKGNVFGNEILNNVEGVFSDNRAMVMLGQSLADKWSDEYMIEKGYDNEYMTKARQKLKGLGSDLYTIGEAGRAKKKIEMELSGIHPDDIAEYITNSRIRELFWFYSGNKLIGEGVAVGKRMIAGSVVASLGKRPFSLLKKLSKGMDSVPYIGPTYNPVNIYENIGSAYAEGRLTGNNLLNNKTGSGNKSLDRSEKYFKEDVNGDDDGYQLLKTSPLIKYRN